MKKWSDPIVDELHAIRARIAGECGDNPEELLKREREILKRWKGRVVTKKDLRKMRLGAHKGATG